MNKAELKKLVKQYEDRLVLVDAILEKNHIRDDTLSETVEEIVDRRSAEISRKRLRIMLEKSVTAINPLFTRLSRAVNPFKGTEYYFNVPEGGDPAETDFEGNFISTPRHKDDLIDILRYGYGVYRIDENQIETVKYSEIQDPLDVKSEDSES